MTEQPMTCDTFDQRLQGLLEGDLAGADQARVRNHAAACTRCAGVLHDMESIRAQAAALPDMMPSRDLWVGIESRITAPVVALPASRVARRTFARPMWLAAAGLALVAGTSAITYYATSRSLGGAAAERPAAVAQHPVSSPPVIVAQAPEPAPTAPAPAARSERASASRGSLVSNDEAARAVGPEATYTKEIQQLQRALRLRRSQLDPATVAEVENNLRVIDEAIRRSRAALTRDPASGFLSEQLTHALDKKVELLRTVAFLPAST